MEQKRTIGWGQFLMLLFMCRVFTLMTFVPFIPEDRSLSVHIRAALISALIQGILFIPIILLNRGVTEAALERNKVCGIIAAVLYFVFFVFYTVNSLLHFRSFLSSRFFPTADSSLWVAVLLLICVYCGCLGIEALGRSGVIVFWLFAVSLAVMTISSAGDFDTVNICLNTERSEELFPAVIDDLSRNGEICAAAFLAKHVSKGLRKGIYGLLAAKVLLTVLVSVLVTAVLGNFAEYTDYPFLAVGTFGGTGFIQRGDSLYLIVWTVTAVINSALFLHISAGLIGEIFPRLKFRTLISAAVVFAVSLFFTMNDRPFSGIYNIICSGWTVILLTGIIPLLVLIWGKRKVKRSDV